MTMFKNFEEWLYVTKGAKEEDIQNNSTCEMLFHEYAEEMDEEEMDLDEIRRLNNLPEEEREKDLY